MRIRSTVASVVVLSLLWASSGIAQQRHVIDPAQMRQAVAGKTLVDQQNRDAVLGVLHQPQVRELAARLGLSVTRAEGAVSTLDSGELAQLAASARLASADLAGGRSVIVISTTALLLIVLIIVLIAR